MTCFGKTSRENQANVKIAVYEGEQRYASGNTLLGTVELKGITPSKKGNEIIDIMVKMDEKGELSVNAIDRRTKLEKNLTIERPKEFTETEIAQMVKSMDELLKGFDENVFIKRATKLPQSVYKRFRRELKAEDVDDDGYKPIKLPIPPVYGQRLGERFEEEEEEEDGDVQLVDSDCDASCNAA